MRNLILQHFDGDLRPLDYESQWNIMDYADMINADYKLIRGKPFRQNLTNACQKVHMIHEEFDEWDNVLMLDIDMFRPRNMSINVFMRHIGVVRYIKWIGTLDKHYVNNLVVTKDGC